MVLADIGFDKYFKDLVSQYKKENINVARVIKGHKKYYMIFDGKTEYLARVSGSLRHNSRIKSEMPAVGDFVLFRPSKKGELVSIKYILKRKNVLFRKSASKKSDIQAIAANVNYCFIVVSLDREINQNSISRYLSMVIASNIKPIVVLTKSDLCDNDDVLEEIEGIRKSFRVEDIFNSSIIDGQGMDCFAKYIKKSTTSIFIGPSGAGKSSIVNYLIGNNIQEVKSVREYDDKGMHTTTSRELFVLKNNAVIIDTPGLRSLGIWDNDSGVKSTFADIEEQSKLCRFHNCTHQHEPGCAIIEMVETGFFTAEHYMSYITLKNESSSLSKQNLIDMKKEKRQRIKKVIKSKKN